MPNLVLPTRALYVVNKAIDLFHHRGFHLIGVDRIVKESEITKATFYNYCLLYTSPSPRDRQKSRMPSSA